ncbi:MAG: hypothetical protein WEE67_09130 [Chloroflexota bacterium]
MAEDAIPAAYRVRRRVQSVISHCRGDVEIEAGLRATLDQNGVDRQVGHEVDRFTESGALNGELDFEVAVRIDMEAVAQVTRLNSELVVVVAD